MNTPLTNSPTTKTATNGHHGSAAAPAVRPNPQVQERASRRRFTAAYKTRILKEADACHKPGELGALLRREGLYSSTLANFRKLRQAGKLGEKNTAQAHKQRQDKEAARQRDARRLAALEAENHKLRVLLELQKKVAALLDLSVDETRSDEEPIPVGICICVREDALSFPAGGRPAKPPRRIRSLYPVYWDRL